MLVFYSPLKLRVQTEPSQEGSALGLPYLGGQQPSALGEVEDGLHHPVPIQQAEDVPDTRLLPQRLAQAPARLVVLHGRGAPQQHPRAAEGREDCYRAPPPRQDRAGDDNDSNNIALSSSWHMPGMVLSVLQSPIIQSLS